MIISFTFYFALEIIFIKEYKLEQTAESFTRCINPATGEEIGTVPVASIEELTEVIRNARIAQTSWSALSLDDRKKYLLKVREYIIENVDEIADTISLDNGKLTMDALNGELIPIVIAIGYYCRISPRLLKNRKLKSASWILSFKKSFVRRLPLGVVGIISPWNYPFSIPMFEVIPGLLAGNSIILKTASETQLVAGIIKDAFKYAEIPEGVMNVVNVPGRIIGDQLLEQGIDKLFFTGSFEVGRKLAVKAAENFIPVSLELGGNDSMIVCKNADIDRAVGGAIWGGFHNAGQSCGGIERIYVESEVYNDFMMKLKHRVENLHAGFGKELTNDLGCITTDKQLETIKNHVEDALTKGAQVFARSKVQETIGGSCLPAMVLTNVNHDMMIMREETFGPVVCVMKVKNVDEAIELTNDSDLGLTASIWTKNNKYGIELSKRIQAGVVNINDHLMSHGLAETPWGGMKKSGSGRSHGEFGLLEMTEPQVVVRDILPYVKNHLWWHPYNEALYNALKGLVYFKFGKIFKNRLQGIARLIRVIPRIFKKI